MMVYFTPQLSYLSAVISMHKFPLISRNMTLSPRSGQISNFSMSFPRSILVGLSKDLALSIFHSLQLSHLLPDAVCCSAAIGACERGRCWHLAVALLAQLATTTGAGAVGEEGRKAVIQACERGGPDLGMGIWSGQNGGDIGRFCDVRCFREIRLNQLIEMGSDDKMKG